MYESKIYPTKHQVLVWELEKVVEGLRTFEYNQHVADTGDLAAEDAANMIEAAIKKSEEPIHG